MCPLSRSCSGRCQPSAGWRELALSLNRMTLLLHPLPHRASGASVGDFLSSRRVVVAVAAWKAILLLRSTAADANHHRFHHHGDLVWCRRCVLAIEIRSRANHVSWPLAGKISPIFRMALETSVYLLLLQYSSLLPFPLYLPLPCPKASLQVLLP